MKLVLYFADGFAWQYVEERPFMEDAWDRRMPLETLLGYSSTVMPSILTGQWPRDTGMWTEYYFQPRERSALARLLTRPRLRFALLPVDLMRLLWFRFGRITHRGMEHRLRLPLELTHLFERHPIQYDQFPPIGLPVPSLADLFAERGLRVSFRYISGGIDPAAELAHLSQTQDEHDVFFYYDPSLDSTGHVVGASAEALAPALDRVSDFLSQAIDLLDGDDLEALLFSDHGMTTVRSTFDLFRHLDGFRLGIDYLVFMDSTIARFWFPDDEMRAAVLKRLAGVPGKLLDEEDKRRLGIDFADPTTYGQEVLAADEGVVFHPNYFAGPFTRLTRKYPEKAMHGYLPEAPSSRGIFFYKGSRWTDPSPDPFSATDIYGIVDAVTSAVTAGSTR